MVSQRHLSAASAAPEESDSPVQICLLGAFALLKHGLPMPVRTGGKTESLLSLLALRARRRVPREEVLNEVWPDADLELSNQALNSLLHSLRKLLAPTLGGAPPVTYTQGFYQLNLAAGIGVDFHRFDELADKGDAHLLRNVPEALAYYHEAIELYTGDLHAGDRQQAIIERERLRARYLTLLARSAAYHAKDDHMETCLRLALRLLEHDPCREDAHRLVMRCYVQRGERAQALRQYRLCERILLAEFDAKPEPSTVALFEQIRLDPISV